MSVKPPRRWTPRSLTAMFLPHLFRKPRNFAEAIGPSTEKVPLDANENHMFIKRKSQKMRKGIDSAFTLKLNKPKDAPKHAVWSIATGGWVPEHLLKLEYIFPFSLGPMVGENVSKRIVFRQPTNGMLIPPAVGLAFNEWALVISPPKDCHHEELPTSYLFTTLEPDAKSLRAPVLQGWTQAVRDLNGEKLHFRSNARLNPHSCYFHSCCAMWKSTFLEDPDRRAEEFWERFQVRMDDLWGNSKDRRKILDIFKPPELVKPEEMDEREAKFKNAPSSADGEGAVGQLQGGQEAVEEKDYSTAQDRVGAIRRFPVPRRQTY